MKDLKISKELIKAVLQKETETLSKDFNFTINEDYIEFSDDGEMQFEYCIYKFAFKCKEWVNKQDYDNNCFVTILYEDGTSKTIITEDGFGFNGNTEIDAIIKTCDYILEQKVNK